MGQLEIGMAMAVGALLSSPSDVPGNQKHRFNGILLSIGIAVLASLAGAYLHLSFWSTLIFLGLTMFVLAYLAVFGFRASLVGFSGLLAIILSFANLSKELSIAEKALYIGAGGLLYLLLTLLWQKLNPKGQTEQFLSETIELTGNYLEVRAKLISSKSNREDLQKELLLLQGTLIEKQNLLREILISKRKSSGNSNYQNKRLLIFINLVDILELAIANPVNYDNLEVLSTKYPKETSAFQDLIYGLSDHLKRLSGRAQVTTYFKEISPLEVQLKNLKAQIDSLKIERTDKESYLFFSSFYNFYENQTQKVRRIEALLKNNKEKVVVDSVNVQKFLSVQEYDPKLLLDHFHIKSPIFRHSLRLAIVVLLGYAIGVQFALQNAYWILLTIVVILRPNYGLTKSRSLQRIAGTLIGAGIASVIVLTIQSTALYATLAILTLVLAFAMVQKNYKTAAAFITISVVFIYALLKADILQVIQYRIIDTLIGAGLATLGGLFLWPTWEMHNIRSVMAGSMLANQKYFRVILEFMNSGNSNKTHYKLARKEAFIENSNLGAAFQRMTQEPKSKQKNIDLVYEIVALNNSFLATLASIGSYLQTHAVDSDMEIVQRIKNIQTNINDSIALLDSEKLRVATEYTDFIHLQETSSKISDESVAIFEQQLKWLHSISERLQTRIKKLQ
jgi:uncharacterized membrane protein YccC